MNINNAKKIIVNFLSMVMAIVLVLYLCYLYYGREIGEFKNKVSIVNGMRMASQIKTDISEYYQSNNSFPNSSSELFLPKPEEFADGAVKSLGLESEGVIKITYNEKSGIDNGLIYIVPDVSRSWIGITWKCISTNIKNISSLIEECHFDEGYKLPASKQKVSSTESPIPIKDDAVHKIFQPSFDCSKSANEVEKLVCGSSTLSEADVNLSVIYKSALHKSKNKKVLQKEQNNWRKIYRDSCQNEECILYQYRTRTKELEGAM